MIPATRMFKLNQDPVELFSKIDDPPMKLLSSHHHHHRKNVLSKFFHIMSDITDTDNMIDIVLFASLFGLVVYYLKKE